MWSKNKKVDLAQENKKYNIGDFAQGGIIFWLDESGEHGLVCAKEDYSELVPWDTQLRTGAEGTRTVAPENAIVLSLGDGPYSGELNTAIIVAARVWRWKSLCRGSLQ